MTKKMRFLQRVKRSRTRLRDAAALQVATADIERRRRSDDYHKSADELELIVGGAAERYGAISSSNELAAMGDEMQALRFSVRVAQQDYATANREVQGKSSVLHERERELRATERLMERLAEAENKRIEREEQRGADDLSGARQAREGAK